MATQTKPRNYYRYHFINDGTIVHRGITNDLARRESEHKQKWPKGWIKQIGPAVTYDSALEWERAGGVRV